MLCCYGCVGLKVLHVLYWHYDKGYADIRLEINYPNNQTKQCAQVYSFIIKKILEKKLRFC